MGGNRMEGGCCKVSGDRGKIFIKNYIEFELIRDVFFENYVGVVKCLGLFF